MPGNFFSNGCQLWFFRHIRGAPRPASGSSPPQAAQRQTPRARSSRQRQSRLSALLRWRQMK